VQSSGDWLQQTLTVLQVVIKYHTVAEARAWERRCASGRGEGGGGRGRGKGGGRGGGGARLVTQRGMQAHGGGRG